MLHWNEFPEIYVRLGELCPTDHLELQVDLSAGQIYPALCCLIIQLLSDTH